MPLSVDSPAPLSTTVPPSRNARVRTRNEAGATSRSVRSGAVYVTHPWCLVRPGGLSAAAPIRGPPGQIQLKRWGSVDVEDRLAADAAAEQGIDSGAGLAPGALELDLAVQSPGGGQRGQAGEVTGGAAVP